jgi:hypothetical protein
VKDKAKLVALYETLNESILHSAYLEREKYATVTKRDSIQKDQALQNKV